MSFLVDASIKHVGTALRKYMKENNLSIDGLFDEVRRDSESLSKDGFLSYLQDLPQKLEQEDLEFSPERQLDIFKCLDKDKDDLLNLQEFKELVRRRFVCMNDITMTDVRDISNSKTLGKLDSNDLLDAYGDPEEEATGIVRIECSLVPGSKSGWVTMQGNGGTTYLQPYCPFDAFDSEASSKIKEAIKYASTAQASVKNKLLELRGAAQGPLSCARAELQKQQGKIAAGQAALDTIRKKMAVAKRDYAQKEKLEANAHIEARERKAAEALLSDTRDHLKQLEVRADEFRMVCEPFASMKEARELNEYATPASTLEKAEELVKLVVEVAEAAKLCASEQQGKISDASTAAMSDAKQFLSKAIAKVQETVSATTSLLTSLKSKCAKVISDLNSKASAVLRQQMHEKGLSHEEFFTELAAGGDRISEEAFIKHLQSLDGQAFNGEHGKLLCRRMEDGGLSHRGLLKFLETYFVVVKPIAVTTVMDINKAKTLRKAEVAEIIVIQEGPCMDEKCGLSRIKGRSLTSGTEGWITVRGNAGTPYLQEVEKPYYLCAIESAMHEDCRGGQLVRNLKSDEVMELLEGPRKEHPPNALRVRIKAVNDGAEGWCTVKDRKGNIMSQMCEKFFVCTAAVVMTDDLDIKNCKVLRKLAVDEIVLALEGPVQEPATNITRIRGRSVRDGGEGWVTVKGNAGTVYVEPSSAHYTVLEEIPLQKANIGNCADVVRMLAKDEVLSVLEGPTEEVNVPEVWVKGRTLSDATEGWVQLRNFNMKPWSPFYTCLTATQIHTKLVIADAEVVRDLQVDEVLELLDGPSEETSSKEMRMKGRAKKDGAIGWVTIKDGDGKRILEPKT